MDFNPRKGIFSGLNDRCELEDYVQKLSLSLIEDFYTRTETIGSYDPANLTANPTLFATCEELLHDALIIHEHLKAQFNETPATHSHYLQEKDAYALLSLRLKLMEEFNQSSRILNGVCRALLSNTEFLKLFVLLLWSENSAYFLRKDELAQDCANIQRLSFDITNGVSSLDYSVHGLRDSSLENLNVRVFEIVFALVRCGKFEEAIELLSQCGLPALASPLQLRTLLRDILKHDKTLAELRNLHDSLLLLKRTVKTTLTKNVHSSRMEGLLWAVVSGNLEISLEYFTSSEDRLWCYLNSAVDFYLYEFLSKISSHGTKEIVSHSNDVFISVRSIFDRVCKHYADKAVYLRIYQCLISDEITSEFIDILYDWCTRNDSSLHPDMLRFITHITLFYLSSNPSLLSLKTDTIILKYCRLLISAGFYDCTPFYFVKMSSGTENNIHFLDFLGELQDAGTQIKVLAKAEKFGYPVYDLCVAAFVRVFEARKLKEIDSGIMNTWLYLLYCRTEIADFALHCANDILLIFFDEGRLEDAEEMLVRSNPVFLDIENSLSGNPTGEEKISSIYRILLLNAVTEYQSYKFYLTFLVFFEKQIQNKLDSIALQSTTSHSIDHRLKMTIDEIPAIFTLISKFLVVDERFHRGADKRLELLNRVRSRYLLSILSMLITLCSHGSLCAVDLIAFMGTGASFAIENVPKDELRKILNRLSALVPDIENCYAKAQANQAFVAGDRPSFGC